MALTGGIIQCLGADSAVLALAGSGTRVMDMKGHMVMPGIIDGHLHILEGAADDLYNVRLTADMSFADILKEVERAAHQNLDREWILGGRFGPNAVSTMKEPGALRKLDAVSNGRPVVLKHVSAHSHFVNSVALAKAEITEDIAEPELGSFGRDPETGRLNGNLHEMAGWPVLRAITAYTEEQNARLAQHGVGILNGFGVTGFLDAFSTRRTLDAFRRLDGDDQLNAWAGFCLGLNATWENGDDLHNPEELARDYPEYASQRVLPSFAKIFLDGVPSLRTAAMLEPYSRASIDEPETDGGATILDMQALTTEIARYDRMGLTAKVHAIGDRAVRMVLDAVEQVRKVNGSDGPPHQIAHMNLIAPVDVPRLASLNVTADLCPPLWYPGTASAGHARAVGSKRYQQAWPIRSIVESGALAMAGSDWPTLFATPNPWPGLAGMITRASDDPMFPDTQAPEQALELETALKLYTVNAARALGIADRTGSLQPGMSADFIILDRNLHDIAPRDIANTNVLATVFQGRVVHGDLEILANRNAI
jgi:predicted amidohydrolase YtcJ